MYDAIKVKKKISKIKTRVEKRKESEVRIKIQNSIKDVKKKRK